MAQLPPYSVLMSVYYKEAPEHLVQSIESILGQTVKPADFVIVCDGVLGDKLDAVISHYETTQPDTFCIVRLPENKGLANALNCGIKYCKCEYVARMDSDDISMPHRIQRQLVSMQRHHADICSGTIGEFSDSPDKINAKRQLPCSDSEIKLFAKRRNPFNHPCVMYKKSVVLKNGGYEEYPYFEDYQLWIKILGSGGKGHNIRHTLLKMRTGNGMYRRRGGWKYFCYAKKLENYKLKSGFSRLNDYLFCLAVKFVFSMVPNGLRTFLYTKLLRK